VGSEPLKLFQIETLQFQIEIIDDRNKLASVIFRIYRVRSTWHLTCTIQRESELEAEF